MRVNQMEKVADVEIDFGMILADTILDFVVVILIATIAAATVAWLLADNHSTTPSDD